MKILYVALNTLKEIIRDRILIGVVILSMLFIVSSIVTVNFTVGQWMRITTDVGLASISMFGIILSVFIGISLINREVERKTVYSIISKPVSRTEFLLGKYFGLLMVLFLTTLLMLGVLFGVLLYIGGEEVNPYMGIFQCWILMFTECMLVGSVAILFSTFTTPTLGAMFTLGIWLSGHLLSDLVYWSLVGDEPVMVEIVKVVAAIVPNLEIMNMRNRVTYFISIEWSYIGWVTCYAALYSAFFLVLASTIFSRKDMK